MGPPACLKIAVNSRQVQRPVDKSAVGASSSTTNRFLVTAYYDDKAHGVMALLLRAKSALTPDLTDFRCRHTGLVVKRRAIRAGGGSVIKPDPVSAT
ncbi:hypothetical protein EVAR_92138_1 [Eumeta japonica]|uniref:Uncharacterized protein n=1 Tax=Eumeta variegata TaxID=151549 RepID=A0A4C1T1W4_EUMVA|nr:hypothetical protein EVAR_92138_1 [Eumeta japonica]